MSISTRQRLSRRQLVGAGAIGALSSLAPGLSRPRFAQARPGRSEILEFRRRHQPATPPNIEFRVISDAGEGSLLHRRHLRDLQVWDDRVYVGFGDWQTNANPIPAVYLDVTTGALVHDERFAFDDGGIESYVVIDGVLWAIGIATLETDGPVYGNLYRKTIGGFWEKLATVPGANHLFALGQLNGVLVVSGTEGGTANIDGQLPLARHGTVWQSFDGGQTWQVVTNFGATNPSENPFSYASSIINLGDRLIVTTPTSGSFEFDGLNWFASGAVPHTPYGVTKCVQFGNVAAMVPYLPRSYTWAGSLTTSLVFSDGQESWWVDGGMVAHDLVVEDGVLYVLATDRWGGFIMAMDDVSCRCLDDMDVVAEMDGDIIPRSLERSHFRFIVGCTDGRLLRSTRYRP